jgi:hypothetical protein
MTLKQFIKENRAELDAMLGLERGMRNDRERALWIQNDESLYLWAKSCGVRGI